MPNSTPSLTTNTTTTTTTATATGDTARVADEKKIGGVDGADDDMLEDGEVVEDEGKRDMDYEVADENEWGA